MVSDGKMAQITTRAYKNSPTLECQYLSGITNSTLMSRFFDYIIDVGNESK